MAWLTVIFAGFGLYAPRNASVIAALLMAALALAGPIFMMLEMDQPTGYGVGSPAVAWAEEGAALAEHSGRFGR